MPRASCYRYRGGIRPNIKTGRSPARLSEGYFHTKALIIWIRNERVYKHEYLPAAQRLDVSQYFGGKPVLVLGDDVSFNFVRTGPQEIAKWALAPWLMYLSQMSLELLQSRKGYIAVYTSMLHPATGTRGSTFAAPSGVLSSSMLSCSAGLGLGYVSTFLDHGTRRCLPGWGESRIAVSIQRRWAALQSLPECCRGTKVRLRRHDPTPSILDCSQWLLQGLSNRSTH